MHRTTAVMDFRTHTDGQSESDGLSSSRVASHGRLVSAAAVYRYAALSDYSSGPFVFVGLLLCAALLLVPPEPKP